MKRILMCIEYCGKDFCGWQSQPNKRTVQGVLTEALSCFFNENIEIFASGRTDSGVHAYNQYAHFDIHSDFIPEKIPFAINTKLPEDVRIKSAVEVPKNFNARYNVKKKTYEYKIYTSPIFSPIKNGFFAQIKKSLNYEHMKQVGQHFLGTHDFSGFMSTNSSIKTFTRTIYDVSITKQDNEYIFRFCGNGFLYNMVRIIVGTLVEVGMGNINPNDIPKIINSKDRKLAGKTMPACGLYLKDVSYEEFTADSKQEK